MSAFALITSASPLKADVAAVGRESPKLTLSGHKLEIPLRGFAVLETGFSE